MLIELHTYSNTIAWDQFRHNNNVIQIRDRNRAQSYITHSCAEEKEKIERNWEGIALAAVGVAFKNVFTDFLMQLSFDDLNGSIAVNVVYAMVIFSLVRNTYTNSKTDALNTGFQFHETFYFVCTMYISSLLHPYSAMCFFFSYLFLSLTFTFCHLIESISICIK